MFLFIPKYNLTNLETKELMTKNTEGNLFEENTKKREAARTSFIGGGGGLNGRIKTRRTKNDNEEGKQEKGEKLWMES